MKDISTPVPPHEVRAVIKKSLENAALVNYERLSEEARIEGKCAEMSLNAKVWPNIHYFLSAELAHPPQEEVIGEVVIPPARKLQDLIRLAELCVDLLRQNEEFYAEVISTLSSICVVLSCCHQHQLLCENWLFEHENCAGVYYFKTLFIDNEYCNCYHKNLHISSWVVNGMLFWCLM